VTPKISLPPPSFESAAQYFISFSKEALAIHLEEYSRITCKYKSAKNLKQVEEFFATEQKALSLAQ